MVKSLFIADVGSDLALPVHSQSTFPKPAILREGDTKNKTKNRYGH